MQSPDILHDGRDDHDYHLPRSEEDNSMEDFVVPVRRRLNHSRDNTDHDYLAAAADNAAQDPDVDEETDQERDIQQEPAEAENVGDIETDEPENNGQETSDCK